MTIMAILQNQWFKKPENVERILARHNGDLTRIARFRRAALFFGCLTGRRLLAAFGEELCGPNGIIWTEASPKIAGRSSGVFPPDPDHIQANLEHFRPDIVLVFGEVARAGLLMVRDRLPVRYDRIEGPHPAARRPDVVERLRFMADQLRRRMAETAGVA